jgi:hypothetical protein
LDRSAELTDCEDSSLKLSREMNNWKDLIENSSSSRSVGDNRSKLNKNSKGALNTRR